MDGFFAFLAFVVILGFFVFVFTIRNITPKPATKVVYLQDENIEEPIIKELQYFYIKDKGYNVSVWPKDQGMQNIDYIEFNIAGLTHRENIMHYIGEHVGLLEAEPENEYDENAIKILAEDRHHVGYVPRDMTDEIKKNTILPCLCYFYIGCKSEEEFTRYYSDAFIKM